MAERLTAVIKSLNHSETNPSAAPLKSLTAPVVILLGYGPFPDSQLEAHIKIIYE